MVTENLQQIKVSVSSLVVRNGIYQAVLEYYDENGKRQQPWEKFNKDKIVLIDFFQNFIMLDGQI